MNFIISLCQKGDEAYINLSIIFDEEAWEQSKKHRLKSEIFRMAEKNVEIEDMPQILKKVEEVAQEHNFFHIPSLDELFEIFPEE